jgi:hypothetical protein
MNYWRSGPQPLNTSITFIPLLLQKINSLKFENELNFEEN